MRVDVRDVDVLINAVEGNLIINLATNYRSSVTFRRHLHGWKYSGWRNIEKISERNRNGIYEEFELAKNYFV